MPDKGPSLEDIVADLTDILDDIRIEERDGAVAHYEAIQQGLPELHLHILTYTRFLEDQEFLVYDRIADHLSLTDAGRDALQDPEAWRPQVAQAFADQIVEADDALDDNALVSNQDDLPPSSESLETESDTPVEDAAAAEPVAEKPAAEAPAVDDLELFADSAFDGPGPASATPATEVSVVSDEPSNNQRPNAERDVMNKPAQHQENTNEAELYQRVEELGVGGVGTVFRANQVKLKRDVALKVVDQVFNVFAGVKRADIVASFTEVVQRQASLVHPNIVQVLDIETDAEFPYVVTQFAPRGNLRRLIEMPERPTLSVALKYFMQILSALSTAHDNDIIHGNLKPENVVLDAAGNAMISDFGMANVVEREDANTAHVYVGVGTVAYMSPEQFQNPNSATEQSDIYSLGIMLYEMLTGKVPGRRSPMPSSFYPDIPRSLDDIFDKMSVDDPADRFLNVQEILQELYQAEDVMNLLDNRSGILFMRDPIEFGELGGINLPASAPAASPGATPISAAEAEQLFDEALHESSGAEDSDSDLSEDSDSDFDEDSDVDEEDVLEKLDKYGDMFEEEDE